MSKAKRYNPQKKSFRLKGILLYLLPLPILLAIIISFFSTNGISVIKYSIAYALFLLSASIAKKGFDFERVYENSPLAKAPRLPYKTLSAVILSVATFYTSYFCVDNSLIFSIVTALSALFGFYLFYGFDPREDKVGNLRVGIRAEDVIAITGQAKEKIAALETIRGDLRDQKTREDLSQIIEKTKEIIHDIEEDPNDLSKARKFFNIYLDRVHDISQEFVKNLKKGTITKDLQSNYEHLLDSMKKTIIEQKEKLNDDDILSLDIQIEALAKQLNQEGV